MVESPQVVDGHYYCSRCAAKLAGAAPSAFSAPLKDSAAPVDDRIKFRCTGCGALLSSRRVSQKSRLRCPQCRTELFLNPDGSVEPVVKTRQSSTPALKTGISRPQTGFSREELEQVLDLQKGSYGKPDETAAVGQKPVAAPPPPPPKPIGKDAAAQSEDAARMRIGCSGREEKRYKRAVPIVSEAGEGLVVFVAVLLLLPAVFILLVSLNVAGLGAIKDGFKQMAQRMGEAALRLRGVAPNSEQQPSAEKKFPAKPSAGVPQKQRMKESPPRRSQKPGVR